MEVPILLDGAAAGQLNMTQSGLYTILEAEADGSAERLVRLWVHGGGKSAYLGVMQPRGGRLYLRRRLSRRELAAFPSPIEYTSDREHEAEADAADGSLHNDDSTGAADELKEKAEDGGLHKAETDHHACPWPASLPEGDLLWYARPDGTLVSHDGISCLLALPEELRTECPRAAEREIEGRKYLIFRY